MMSWQKSQAALVKVKVVQEASSHVTLMTPGHFGGGHNSCTYNI